MGAVVRTLRVSLFLVGGMLHHLLAGPSLARKKVLSQCGDTAFFVSTLRGVWRSREIADEIIKALPDVEGDLVVGGPFPSLIRLYFPSDDSHKTLQEFISDDIHADKLVVLNFGSMT